MVHYNPLQGYINSAIGIKQNIMVKEFEGEETLKLQHGDIGTEVYPDAVLNISREPASVFQLKRRWEKKPSMLDLTPDFQRELVWSQRKKSELIESILMGIPLPAFYVREQDNGVYVVVDGKQRLTTLFDYMDEKFKLESLKILKEMNGKGFKDLTPLQQNKLEDYSLQLNVIKAPTSDRVIFDLFDRVNRGGVTLNNQEMRNALYQGNATRLINELAKNESFKKATENAATPKHMKDRYLVLRFVAFYLLNNHLSRDVESGNILEYKSNLEDFLGQTMRYINSLDEHGSEMNQIRTVFNETMKMAASEVVQLGGFRLLPKPGGNKRPINMAFFESFCYLISRIQGQFKSKIADAYIMLQNNQKYVYSLTHSVDSKVQLENRNECIEETIKQLTV